MLVAKSPNFDTTYGSNQTITPTRIKTHRLNSIKHGLFIKSVAKGMQLYLRNPPMHIQN